MGEGLTLVPIIARLMPLLGARFVALLGGDLPGRERDFFFSGLGILLSRHDHPGHAAVEPAGHSHHVLGGHRRARH